MSTYKSEIDFAQVLKQSFDNDAQSLKTLSVSQLVPKEFDSIQLAYTGDDVTEVTYKKAGATVAVLTLTYNTGKLIQVSRS